MNAQLRYQGTYRPTGKGGLHMFGKRPNRFGAPNESVQVNSAPPTSTSIRVNAGDASACTVANGIATESRAGQGPGSPPSPVPHIS